MDFQREAMESVVEAMAGTQEDQGFPAWPHSGFAFFAGHLADADITCTCDEGLERQQWSMVGGCAL